MDITRMMPAPNLTVPSDSLESTRLPEHLKAQLSDTRIACARDLPKPVTAEVPDGIAKLCVVEDIEKLSAELKRHALPQAGGFVKREVPIVEPGTMKKTTVCVPKCSQRAGAKAVSREVLVGFAVRPGAPGILDREGPDEVRHVG